MRVFDNKPPLMVIFHWCRQFLQRIFMLTLFLLCCSPNHDNNCVDNHTK